MFSAVLDTCRLGSLCSPRDGIIAATSIPWSNWILKNQEDEKNWSTGSNGSLSGEKGAGDRKPEVLSNNAKPEFNLHHHHHH
jgi:hypothetical protein